MSTEAMPLVEINRKATNILFHELGAVDAIRFFNQFSVGEGDYTKERGQWLDGLTLEEIIADIKAKRDS
jgi:hypothetical protein